LINAAGFYKQTFVPRKGLGKGFLPSFFLELSLEHFLQLGFDIFD